MKKMVFLLIMFTSLRQFAVCQSVIGVKAGLNLSNQQLKKIYTSPDSKAVSTLSSLYGYQLGIFYKKMLNSKWTIAGELNFSLIGSGSQYLSIVADSMVKTSTYKNRIGYLEIPVSIQYQLHRFYFGVGPSISFKLFSSKNDLVDVPAYKTLDAAANLLAGCKVLKKFDINVRYSYGILNILKDKSVYGNGSDNVTTKNRFLNLSLLFSIR